MDNLSTQRCVPCEGNITKLDPQQVQTHLAKLTGWQVNADNTIVTKQFKFVDFHHTMIFINKLASIAQEENHHPDVSFGYNYCQVNYTTHAISGLSTNDFICAAKIDQLTD